MNIAELMRDSGSSPVIADYALSALAKTFATLIDFAATDGMAANELLAGTSLAGADLSVQPVPPDLLIALNNLRRRFRNTDAALRYGARRGLAHCGRLACLLMCQSTLGDACKLLIDFMTLFRVPELYRLETQGELIRLSITLPAIVPAGDPLGRFYVECQFASAVTILSQLRQKPLLAEQVHFCGSPPAYLESIRCRLGRSAHFEASQFALVFHQDDFRQSLPTADRALAKYLVDDFLTQIRTDRQTVQLASRIEAGLDASVGHYPTASQMAQQLNMTDRTLRRRLLAEQVSYQDIVDRVAYRHAQRLLAQHGLSIEDIAQQLGFSNTSNFRRAFRRWSGTTPAQWREGGHPTNG